MALIHGVCEAMVRIVRGGEKLFGRERNMVKKKKPPCSHPRDNLYRSLTTQIRNTNIYNFRMYAKELHFSYRTSLFAK